MNDLLFYILKSTLCLSLLYLAFRTVMRKETFFALNRLLLLLMVACSILIPLINLPQVVQPEMQEKLLPAFPAFENQMTEFPVVADPPKISGPVNVMAEKPERAFPVMKFVGYTYLAGMMISLLVLIHGLLNLLLLFRKAKVQQMEGFRLLIIEKDIPAFSFCKMIFISRADYHEHGATILAHEQQHIRLGHFYDLMLMEMAKITHWFNPVIYWLIRDLKAIHEYQADQYTITKGIDATKYQILIIEKGVGPQRFALANSFNHCQIKNRITMMNKQKTSKAWRWKVAIFLPLLALLLMAFGRMGESEPMEITSAQVNSSPIMGTWKLVSYNYGGGEQLNPVSPDSERLKFITETNFNWVQYVGKDRLVNGSVGGTYVLSGDSYTEYIEFSGQGMTDYIGKAQKFKVKFENNKMHLSGELSSGLKIKEVWEKYIPSDKTSMISPSSTPQKKDNNHMWIENDGTVRYNNEQISFDRMAEKVKSGLKEDPKLPLNIFIEEGKLDEHLDKIKNTLSGVENLNVTYWSFHQEKGTDSNGLKYTKVYTKTIDAK